MPVRYQDQTRQFIDLINHTFIDRSVGFTPYKARELADVLAQDPSQARSVSLAWKALGPNVATILREYYPPTYPGPVAVPGGRLGRYAAGGRSFGGGA